MANEYTVVRLLDNGGQQQKCAYCHSSKSLFMARNGKVTLRWKACYEGIKKPSLVTQALSPNGTGCWTTPIALYHSILNHWNVRLDPMTTDYLTNTYFNVPIKYFTSRDDAFKQRWA